MKTVGIPSFLCLLLIASVVVGCGPTPNSIPDCAIPNADEVQPEVGLLLSVGGQVQGVGSDGTDLVIEAAPGAPYDFIANASDTGCVQRLQVHVEGGAFTEDSTPEKSGNVSDPDDSLGTAGHLKPLSPGVVTLWAEATDYKGNSATTGRLSLVVPGTWQIRLERLKVVDAQEESDSSNGDEPYFVVFGFRSRLATPGSTEVTWRGYLDDDWAAGSYDDHSAYVPEAMGTVYFSDVRPMASAEFNLEEAVELYLDPLSLKIKLHLNLPKVELVGVATLAVESDSTPWSAVRALAESARSSLQEQLAQAIEKDIGPALDTALNEWRDPQGELLLDKLMKSWDEATSQGLDGQARLEQVVEQNEYDIKQAAQSALDKTLGAGGPDSPSLWEQIALYLGSWFDAEDMIGFQVLCWTAVEPSFASDMLTLPVLREGWNVPVMFSGNGAQYEVTVLISTSPMLKSHTWSDYVQVDGVGIHGDGAGVAYTELNGNGRPEMVLLAYDNPDGQNNMRYKVGWDVQPDGTVSRWDTRIIVDEGEIGADWGNHGDGAGIAFTELNGNGRPEMVLMAYDNPDGANNFRYAIGWDVTVEGRVSRWSRRIIHEVAGIGLHGDGAGIAFANLNGDPRPELILMAYDNPSSENSFRYVIGWDVGTDGTVSSWDERFTSVAGLGTRGEGADLLVTNLDQDPRPEMILMAYDAPEGANSFRYKVGWNMGTDGKTVFWSRMTQIEGVGSVADGAGLALADLDGNGYPEMVLMAYDNPDGGNSFRYRIGWDLRPEW